MECFEPATESVNLNVNMRPVVNPWFLLQGTSLRKAMKRNARDFLHRLCLHRGPKVSGRERWAELASVQNIENLKIILDNGLIHTFFHNIVHYHLIWKHTNCLNNE